MNSFDKYKQDTTEFVREVESEVKRITWPTRNEALKSTIAVLSISGIFAVFLALVDYVFSVVIGAFLS